MYWRPETGRRFLRPRFRIRNEKHLALRTPLTVIDLMGAHPLRYPRVHVWPARWTVGETLAARSADQEQD